MTLPVDRLPLKQGVFEAGKRLGGWAQETTGVKRLVYMRLRLFIRTWARQRTGGNCAGPRPERAAVKNELARVDSALRQAYADLALAAMANEADPGPGLRRRPPGSRTGRRVTGPTEP